MTKKGAASKKDESKFPVSQVLISSALGAVLFFLFLIAAAAFSLKSSLNQSLYLAVGLIAGGLSGFTGGFVALKLIKEKGIFYGALVGFIQSLLCAVIIFALNKGTAGNGIFILIAAVTLFSSLGGIAAVNIKKKIKY